jgi:hypothetical protein
MNPSDNSTNQSFLQEQKQAADLFNIDATDHEITSILRNRIAASEKFYDSDPTYKIKETRKKNAQMLFGDHYKAGKYPTLRGSSIQYQEAQVYAAIQTIISYLTSRIPEIEAKPWNNSVSGRLIARDFAKYATAHGIEHDIKGKVERMLYDLMQKRVGAIKMVYDVGYKGKGEICPRHVDPARLIFDHTSDQDGNPGFIAEKINGTIGELVDMFPDKKDEIYEMYNIKLKQGTANQLATNVERFECWVTGRGKDGKPEEQLVIFLGGCVLLKTRNPHWLYDVEKEVISNHLDMPPKPYLTINLLNDGSNKLDQTSLIELVAPQAHSLNRLKRTILEASERYGGLNVFSGEAVDKEDVEDLNFDGDESIIVDSEDVNKAVAKVSPNFLPQWLTAVADDLVATIHSIIGTPPNMRGDTSDTETLGEAIMQRDQAEGRLEPLVRALDNFFNRYFALFYHMAKVHYTEEHWQIIAGDDGTFDYVMMQRDRLADGMDVYVKSGSMLPLDDDRMANIAVKLASMDRIANIDLYKLLKVPNAEEMAQNLIKEKIDPTLIAKNLKEDEGDRTAYQDYEVIMAGKYAPPREDPEANHITTHREQMMRDEYVTGTDRDGNVVWDAAKRQAFVTHVKAEIESLRRRAMAMEGDLANKADAEASPMIPGNEGMLPQPGQAPVEPGMTPAPAPAQGGAQPPMPPLPEPPAAPAPMPPAPQM